MQKLSIESLARQLPRPAKAALRKALSVAQSVALNWDWVHDLRRKVRPHDATFADAYARAVWGSTESGSGTGSELRATEAIRERLADLLRRHSVRSVLDAPCGDWNWMQHVALPAGVEYVGVDLVHEVVARNRERFTRPGVRFELRNIVTDELPKVDLVLCRDCWVHLSFQEIAGALENFRRTGARYLLVNSAPEVEQNRNQFTGHAWRHLNLQRPPFGFPPPVEAFRDGGEVDPSDLCLWRLQELPAVD